MYFNSPDGGFRGRSPYIIERSLRFDAASSADLNATLGTATDRNKWTFFTWLRLGNVDTARYLLCADTASPDIIGFNSSNKFIVTIAGTARLVSTAIFRDQQGWAPVTVAYDPGNATNALRLRVWWGSDEITVWDTDTRSAMSTNVGKINTAVIHRIGRDSSAASSYFDGFMADTQFVDGSALTYTAFTTNTSWLNAIDPARYYGARGTNGFWLPFKDATGTTSTTLGRDFSGSNNFTPNNFSVTAGNGNDSLFESPSRFEHQWNAQVGCFPKFTNLMVDHHGTLTNAGMTVAQTSNGGVAVCGFPSQLVSYSGGFGKYYWEVEVPNASARIGICDAYDGTARTYVGSSASDVGWNGSNYYIGGVATAYGSTTFTAGDIVGVAFDTANNRLYFRVNGGAWAAGADPVAGTGYITIPGNGQPAVSMSGASGTTHINFGQRPFRDAPPTGFFVQTQTNYLTQAHSAAFNIQNINPEDYIATYQYTGSASPQTFNSFRFTPDFIWIFPRNTESRVTLDYLGNCLRTDTTAASSSISGLSLVTNGFSVPANTAGVSTTGVVYNVLLLKRHYMLFDIQSWTGNNTADRAITHNATSERGTGHRFLMCKATSTTGNWYVNTWRMTNRTYWNQLNGTGVATGNTNSPWGTGTTTFQQFMVTNNATNNLNANAVTYVGYVFPRSPGIVEFMYHRGNAANPGSNGEVSQANPQFLLIAPLTAAAGYYAYFDNGFNPQTVQYPAGQASAAVTSSVDVDFLAAGYKIRNTNANVNTTGRNYGTLALGKKHTWAARAR